ncbi:M23 family metallopeptidase [bacterium]|nr:M23 family metallopeptidase [candidate division CSSED10-310 bacterium]
MKIFFNWPDYLIPIVTGKEDLGYIFDLFINTLLLQNDEKVSRRITRIVTDIKTEDEVIWRWELPQPVLWEHMNVGHKISDMQIWMRQYSVGSYIAQDVSDLVPGPVLKPEEKATIRRFPVRFTTDKMPGTLVVRIFSGPHLIGRNDIMVRSEIPSDHYIFPVKGNWQVFNNFDYNLFHRQFASQEFAIDVLRLSDSGLVRKNTSNLPDDFVCYGERVYAIAKGKVIEVSSELPDHSADESLTTSLAHMEFSSNIDFWKTQVGNFVLIRHDNDIFSFYGHLKQHSIAVNPGDDIAQGVLIGEVGNSGSSKSAHLHFQLNKGPNPYASRSIPPVFSNTYNPYCQPLPLITQNLTMVHTAD